MLLSALLVGHVTAALHVELDVVQGWLVTLRVVLPKKIVCLFDSAWCLH